MCKKKFPFISNNCSFQGQIPVWMFSYHVKGQSFNTPYNVIFISYFLIFHPVHTLYSISLSFEWLLSLALCEYACSPDDSCPVDHVSQCELVGWICKIVLVFESTKYIGPVNDCITAVRHYFLGSEILVPSDSFFNKCSSTVRFSTHLFW